MSITTVSPTTASVISADGTTIGYRQYGQGPALILVHGGMQASQNFTRLAVALADTFTVYVPDRRGRGLSGPHGDDYGLRKEVQDMTALIEQTSAQHIFGLSAGAIIALQTAYTIPAIRRVALYEPPIPVSGHKSPTAWVERFDRELAEGNLAGAMASVVKGTGDVSIFTYLPHFLVERLLRLGIDADEKETRPGEVPIRALIPTVHYDPKLVCEMEGQTERYKDMRADVLLLGGSKSQRYLKAALDELYDVLPHCQRVELPGVGHLAADNGGQPERVAQELRRFFALAAH
jgi:pimeloyl-ACP methyl ester carboxylesterase